MHETYSFISLLSVFVMACFVGYYVVWSVTPALHTPLMSVTNAISSVIIVGALIAAGASATFDLSKGFGLVAIVLAVFVGYYVVWNVTPALHTPLMSVTNAISSVIVVGAILAVGVGALASGSVVAMIFGFLALILAAINIFGGFMVTSRMLAMYKKKDK